MELWQNKRRVSKTENNSTLKALQTMTDQTDFVHASRMWVCLVCGWVYDEETGVPDEGIPPGTRWEDVPMNWVCPECGARKEDFEMVPI